MTSTHLVIMTDSEFNELKRTVRNEFDEAVLAKDIEACIEKAQRYGMIELANEMIRDRYFINEVAHPELEINIKNHI